MNVYTNKSFWDSYYGKFKPHTVEKVYFADLFEKYLAPDPQKSILEIGCAGGNFLCYLAKQYKYQAYGLDYSDEIETTRALFAFNNIPEPVLYKEDLFNWNPGRQFDNVCSFGFVEHFSNLNEIIKKHIDLVAPGGTLIITMPHFAHLQYLFHWLIDRENLKKHNTRIMNLKTIKKALLDCHHQSPSRRVEIQYLNYYRTFGFWTERSLTRHSEQCHPEPGRRVVEESLPFNRWERLIYHSIQLFGRLINKLFGSHHPNPLFSPHFVCIAQKKGVK